MEPRYRAIYDKMRCLGASYNSLEWFSGNLANARSIETGASGWERLGRVAASDEAVFRSVAFSMDHEFGKDADGQLYVRVDHALDILESEHERTLVQLRVTRGWAIGLFACSVFCVVNRFLSP